MGAITSGKAGMTNPFKMKKPTVGDFTTPGITRDLTPGAYPGDPRGRTGVQTRPESFDAFGFTLRQKNLQETFPIGADEDNPEADVSKFGSPMGDIDVALQPGPSVPNMQKVDYGILGTDPGILSEQWWRKQYG